VTQTLGTSPGLRKYPEHTIELQPHSGGLTVHLNDTLLAASSGAIAVDETGYERVFYFPPSDVNTNLLIESDSNTRCPFKGEASYLAAEMPAGLVDIAWYYPTTFDEVSDIAGYIAFYRNQVSILEQQC